MLLVPSNFFTDKALVLKISANGDKVVETKAQKRVEAFKYIYLCLLAFYS